MARSFWVAVRVAVPVALWVAIRTATPYGAGNPCTALVSEVAFSGRQGSCSGKRTASGRARVGRRPERHSSLKEAVWMPRPFWRVLWDPFWDPFWRPIRTGSPRAAENPCTARRSDVRSSARQGCALRRRFEGGRVPMPRSGERRLARADDRWSHGRPANRPGAGEEVWR
jgi:hypothetical protein